MADVYSAIILNTNYWDGTTSWAGETSQANRDTKYSTRRFTSVAAWESDRDGNSSGGNDEYGIISGAWASNDTAAAVFEAWNADAIILQCPLTLPDGTNLARHDGKWENVANSYVLNPTDTNSISISDELYVTIDGLQVGIDTPTGANKACIKVDTWDAGAKHTQIKNCVLKGTSGTAHANIGIYIVQAVSVVTVTNTVIFDGNGGYAITGNAAATITVYNCTQGDGYSTGFRKFTTAKNIASFNSTDDFNTFTTVDYCASDDGDGTNEVDWTAEATDWNKNFNAYGTGDYTIGSDGAAADIVGAGIGPGSDANVPSTDIIGNSRAGATCTIGAFEYQAAGGISIPVVQHHRRRH